MKKTADCICAPAGGERNAGCCRKMGIAETSARGAGANAALANKLARRAARTILGNCTAVACRL